MTPWALAAKNIKVELKRCWPKIPFHVRSKVAANSTAIDISWPTGPTPDAVRVVTARYEEGWFDGSTDGYNYHTEPGGVAFRKANGSVKYIFLRNRFVTRTT